MGIHAAKLLIRRLKINTQSPVVGEEGETWGRTGGSCLVSGPQADLDWAGGGGGAPVRLFGGGGLPGAGEVTGLGA